MSTLTSPTRSPVPSSLTSVSLRRKLTDRMVQGLVYIAFLLALIPLVSVLWMVISKGISTVNAGFLTHSMVGVSGKDPGGGVYHAIVGTLEQVALASLVAVPLGVLTAIYLIEYSNNGRLARAISFFVDVMTGIPSIVAGLFILALWLLSLNLGYSGFAGSLALAILMMPTVVRATEEMLKLVPNDLREASFALGVPRWRTICFVVLPTALTGITTGVMLAVARVMGETAPLLLLVFVTDRINTNPFDGPQAALPTYIWYQASDPNQNSIDRAWAAALTLIAIIMLLNLAARLLARLRSPISR